MKPPRKTDLPFKLTLSQLVRGGDIVHPFHGEQTEGRQGREVRDTSWWNSFPWTSNTFPNVTWAHLQMAAVLMPGEQGQGESKSFAPSLSLYRPLGTVPASPTPP